MNTSKVTRVEVIDHTKDVTHGGGRAYFFMQEGVQVELSLQDDDRTLKVFISNQSGTKEHDSNCSIKNIPIELASCTCGISNTMTFKQIEKSVMESKPMRFLTDLHSQMIITRGCPQWEGETVPDVLRQSFIKYLKEECEEVKKIQGDPFDDSDDYLHGVAYCKKELLNKLQAQIKELEG